MTDVAPKTPNKRKSLADQKTPKKIKVENGLANKSPLANSNKQKQTPKFQKNQLSPQKPQMTPNKKNQSPKQKNQQTPKFSINQNKGNKNTPAKNGKGAKVTPFKGTANLKKDIVKAKVEKKVKSESGEKEKRQMFYKIKLQINSTNPEDRKSAITAIDNKMKFIQSKGELTKTAQRKIRILKKFRKIAEGTYVKREPKVAKIKVENKVQGGKQVQAKQNKPGKQVKKVQPKLVVKQEEEDDEESDDEFDEDGESGDENSEDNDSSED